MSSRQQTLQTYQDLFAGQTNAAIIELLIISVPRTTDDDYDRYYLTANSEDVVSSASGVLQTYTAYPITVSAPTDATGRISSGRMTVGNASKDLIDFVIARDKVILVELIQVNSNDVNNVMARYPCFAWRQIEFSALQISGVITMQDFLGEAYPSRTMGPSILPGLFV